MKKLYILILISFFIASESQAESSFLPMSMQHKYAAELKTGYATGNNDSEQITGKGYLTSIGGRYKNELKGSVSAVEQANGGEEEIYRISNKLKYDMGNSDYVFGDLGYVNNNTAGIKNRTSGVAGYGRELFAKDDVTITGEIGAGARQSDYFTGLEDESSYLGRIGAIIDWKIIHNLMLNNTTYFDITEDNMLTTSETSLKSYVYDNLYVKGSFDVEDNDKTPNGFEETDTITSLGIGYDF